MLFKVGILRVCVCVCVCVYERERTLRLIWRLRKYCREINPV